MDSIYLINIVKSFLPPFAEVIILGTPFIRPAIEMIDLDRDGILELVGAYHWKGENYIIVLKYRDGNWQVMDVIKGKGYNITYFKAAPITGNYKKNLVVGWQVASIWSDLSVYKWTDGELKDLIAGNKYYSIIEVMDINGTQGKDGIYELALWIHDTGDAYKVEIYRWEDGKFVLAVDVYPYYFKKVVSYYNKLLAETDSTTYWYYLADAQIKIGNTQDALQSIDRALAFEYPYPSRAELMELRSQLCEYEPLNQEEIDFSDIKYTCSETKRDLKLEKALIKEFELDRFEDSIRYYYNKIDLDGDGTPEIFAYLVGTYVCGTGGCSAVIFKQRNEEYVLLARFSLVNNPVIISDNTTKGYKDIIMHIYGGGIESFFALLKYDGSTYPSNPSTQPKVEPGTKVEGIAIIADDITKNPGIKL